MKMALDKFDTLYWLEGCSIGSHLRQGCWERMIDAWKDCTEGERLFFYLYAKRDISYRYNIHTFENGTTHRRFGGEMFDRFLACYNPANRYEVTASDGKITETVQCYKWGGVYCLDSKRIVPPEYVKEVKHFDFEKCGNVFCELKEKCVRFKEGVMKRNQWDEHLGCEEFITDNEAGYDNVEHEEKE